MKLGQEAQLDAGLVRRFLAGDEAAFAEIVIRYRARMFAVGFATLKNHADAEEIAQDTFIRAHRALVNFRGDASLATWLYRIALNLARNRYWYFFRRHRHATISLDSPIGEAQQATFSDRLVTDAADPAREALITEFSELVGLAMDRLGKGAREILILRNSRDYSYEEIARELGISLGTVKSRIARARASLRALVDDPSPEAGPPGQPRARFNPVHPAARRELACA